VTRATLRSDAALLLVVALLLLASTWTDLYDALGLPLSDPELYAQLAGAVMLAVAYLLWIAPRDVRLTQAVAASAALGNGLSAAILLVWLGTDRVDSVLLWLFVPVLAAFAALEAWIARRNVAMLLPAD
jgi:hypothetical protein